MKNTISRHSPGTGLDQGPVRIWAACWRLLYRGPWLLVHVLIGLPITAISCADRAKASPLGRRIGEYVLCWWSRGICAIFGVQPKFSGEFAAAPRLIVANHISWLDIFVLHSTYTMSFVAKAEIEKWPLAGWVASFGDTIYHHRGDHDSARGVVALVAERLRGGHTVAIFAEGGILRGPGVKPFHARLFAAAIDTAVPVQPVMLRYVRYGVPYPDITFLPGEHFMANFFRLLCQPACVVEVEIMPPIDSQGKQRRELANEAQAAVAKAFNAEPKVC